MTDPDVKQAVAEIWQLFWETDARLDQRFAETDRRMKETAQQMKETDAKLRRLEGLFGNQWGKLIEALVQPSVLGLFQRRGHNVRRLHQRSKAQRNSDTMEINIILEDGNEVVAVEVKSTLTLEAVNEFLLDLHEFNQFFPLYKDYRIYGAVAGLDISSEVERYAYRKGLFVLRVTGEEMIQITNDEKFIPQDFAR